jgi:tetratricopeptide (TPR) repeat protein
VLRHQVVARWITAALAVAGVVWVVVLWWRAGGRFGGWLDGGDPFQIVGLVLTAAAVVLNYLMWRHPVSRGGGPDGRGSGGQDGWPRPEQLPVDPATFTGREAELAELLALVPDSRRATAVTITAVEGMGGIGKTALAVRAAHRMAGRFPDGQVFIDLKGFSEQQAPVEPVDALGRLLGDLGVPGQQIPAEVDARAGLWRSLLARRRMLILLDNAAATGQVKPLLPGAPGCLVLVTSRRQLAGLLATHQMSLDVLPPAEAVALFAAEAGPGRLVTQPAKLVAEVVELCWRLPLAVSVAAAMLKAHPVWSVADLAGRLRDQHQRLAQLDDGTRSATAVLEVSYQQLPADQRRLYRLLGLHPGSVFDAYAAAALAGTTPAQAGRLLDRLLADRLLLEPVTGRYVFHDLVAGHAAGMASEQGEPGRRAAVSRLLDHYRHTATVAVDTVYPYDRDHRPRVPAPDTAVPDLPDQARAAEWLDVELPNLLATASYAAAHGWPGHTLHLSTTLRRHLNIRGHYRDAHTLHHQALTIARTLGDRTGELYALHGLGEVHRAQDRTEQATDHYQRALTIARTLGDRHGELYALAGLGGLHRAQSRHEQATDHFQRALTIARTLSDRHGELYALAGLGEVHQAQGRHEQATDRYQQALTIARTLGDRNGQFEALLGLGRVGLATGRPRTALTHHQQALQLATDLGQPGDQARAYDGLAHAHRALGQPEPASHHWQQALDTLTALGVDRTFDPEVSATTILDRLAELDQQRDPRPEPA